MYDKITCMITSPERMCFTGTKLCGVWDSRKFSKLLSKLFCLTILPSASISDMCTHTSSSNQVVSTEDVRFVVLDSYLREQTVNTEFRMTCNHKRQPAKGYNFLLNQFLAICNSIKNFICRTGIVQE